MVNETKVVDFIDSNDSLLVMASFVVSYFFNLNPTFLFPLFAYLKYIKIIIKISLLTTATKSLCPKIWGQF